MAQKTSLNDQITAVSLQAKTTGDDALRDALETLCKLKRVDTALHRREPDVERVEELLTDLLLGS